MTWTITQISNVVVNLKLERVRTLPSVAATHAYVPDISRLDNIMQSLHRLLNRCVRIKAVALQDVDIVELETFQRLLHRIKNVLQMQASQNTARGKEATKASHLATETILIHVSQLVLLGG